MIEYSYGIEKQEKRCYFLLYFISKFIIVGFVIYIKYLDEIWGTKKKIQ